MVTSISAQSTAGYRSRDGTGTADAWP